MKIITAFLLLCSSFCSGQTYSLALNLIKDHSYYLGLRSDHHISGEWEGKKIDARTVMNGRLKFTVVAITPAGYNMDMSVDSIGFVLHGPMGKMEFSYPDSSITGDMGFGKPMRVSMLKNGAITDIENTDTAGLEAMLKKIPIAMMLKNMMASGSGKKHPDKKSMQENRQKMTAIFPDKKVALNETWETFVTPDSTTKDAIKTVYKLVGYTGGTATIQKKTTLTGRGLSGNTESLFQVDAATGWVKQATLKSDLKAGRKGGISITGNATITGWWQ